MSPELVHPDLELDFALLNRCEQTLKEPLRRAFNSGRVDLFPPPETANESDPLARAAQKGRAVFDEKGGRLVVPLLDKGRALALIVIGGVTAEQLAPAVAPYLSSLVEASLDLVRLRLAAETDPVTGLANENAFDEALTHALSRMEPAAAAAGRPALEQAEEEPGLALVALAFQGFAGLQDRYGRRLTDRLLLELARKLRGLGQASLSAARIGQAVLVALRGGAGAVRETHALLKRQVRGLDLATPQGEPLGLSLLCGAATLEPQFREAGGLASEAAAVFKARALRALDCAGRLEDGQPLFFADLLDRAGRVLETLPLDRVRLDLGRVHGLGEDERLAVLGAAEADGRPPLAKAEVQVIAVGETDAVAEVLALGDPTWGIRPGDRLRRVGHETAQRLEAGLERVASVAGRELRLMLDEVSGLAVHRSFMEVLAALTASEAGGAGGGLCAVLMRLEGLEGVRQVAGRVGADALMAALAQAARKAWPNPDWLGRYAPDTLAGLLPGMAAQQAAELTRQAVEAAAAQTGRPLRAGVAYHPCPGFAAADILDNAAKALVHAGYLDAGAVVVCDAVSLNVSGDALFGQGRLHEAVAEYEKGLLISPEEPNLLNSLGVTYGHLGQSDKALECFERARQAAPQDFMARFNLGFALMGLGRVQQARAHLEESLALEPDNPDALFQLGRLEQGQGHLAQAAELFARAAVQPGHRRAVHRHLAEALAATGRPAEAEEAFNQALKDNPHDASALASLAGLYLDRDANREIALSLAHRAHDLDPALSRHQRVLARALLANGRAEEAAGVMAAGLEGPDRDAWWHLQMAQVDLARARRDAAEGHFRRALALEPNLEPARQGLAELAEGPDE
ncbi:MAG: tetratricopeptide repeat protein [Pseudomonadota bacterium]